MVKVRYVKAIFSVHGDSIDLCVCSSHPPSSSSVSEDLLSW